MHIKNKRGQSTVEYILLVTAVVGVMIVFATGQNSTFQGQLTNTLNQVTGDMNTGAGSLSASHAPQSPTTNSAAESLYNVDVTP